MRLKTGWIAAAAVFGLALPNAALADNTTCANAEPLMIGETASDTIAVNGITGFSYYKIRVLAGRSYAAILWQPFEDVGEGGSNTDLTVWSNTTCTVTATQPSIDNDPDTDFPNADADAVSFTPPALATYIIEVDNQAANSYVIRLLVVDTTLNSPWWFTGGTNNAFVEIRNNTPGNRSMTLTAYTSAGVACGSTTSSVPGNGNIAINIKDYAACAAAGSGSAKLTYVGAPGAFVANITTIDGVLGTSFDAPFFPMMVWGSSFSAR
jgi:hypothetical protein